MTSEMTRARGAWAGRRALAVVVVVMMMSFGGVARAQTCEDGCAPRGEVARATEAAERARRERDAVREEHARAKEELDRAVKEIGEVKSRAQTLEREKAAVETDLKRQTSDLKTLERELQSARQELDRTKASESKRVKELEARLNAAEEAWAPVWLQRRATQAVEVGKERAELIVRASQEHTARAVEFGKENIPKVVQAVEKRTKKVVEVGMEQTKRVVDVSREQTMKVVEVSREQTKKVIDVANEQLPKVVKTGKEQTAKLVNVGRGVVDKVSHEVGHISKKITILKELKQDLKEARQIHDARLKTGKHSKTMPTKFSTRQAVRAFDMLDEFATFCRRISIVGFFKAVARIIKNQFVRIFFASKDYYHERIIPATEKLRAATAIHIGTKLAPFVLDIPFEALQKHLSGYTSVELANKIADALLLTVASSVIVLTLWQLFFKPLDENAATYTIMKVPEEHGLDVIVRLPHVESMDQVEIRFDQTWNQISIDAEAAGFRHSEFIEVPKCKTGIKRWAKPAPKFLDGEEIVLIELRPVRIRANGKIEQADIAEPPPPPKNPFAPVGNRAPFAPVMKQPTTKPQKQPSIEKAPSIGRSTRSRRQ